MTTLKSATITFKQLAKTIDHSLLRPEMSEAEVIAGCELAKRYEVASVCVKPCHVPGGAFAGEAVAWRSVRWSVFHTAAELTPSRHSKRELL
jgi:deoxyribose-phosphate aldolase